MSTDDATFTRLVERHRPELQLHCYRMLGSLEDSEDLAQETLLRAWRKRGSFEGRASVRTWLYRIATNACLDALARRPRRPRGADDASGGEVLWLQPYPDHLLEDVQAPGKGPVEAVVSKETIELAFMVAIQHLPPKQRAALIARDVLGWSAKETADLLETSVPAANSALQRARETLKQRLPESRLEWKPRTEPTRAERELLDRYVEATEEADADAFVEIMRDDARFAMPPQPGVWVGPETIVDAWREGGAFDIEGFGHMRCVLTRANMQPAVACYLKRPGGGDYEPMAIDVLRIEEGRIAEIVTFPGELAPKFDLPTKL